MRITIPSATSPEALLIYAQTCCLVMRTLLTDVATRVEGGVGRSIVAGEGAELRRLLLRFCGLAVPAAVVNAVLKYLQRNIKLSFMRRLTLHLHDLYCTCCCCFRFGLLLVVVRAPRSLARSLSNLQVRTARITRRVGWGG